MRQIEVRPAEQKDWLSVWSLLHDRGNTDDDEAAYKRFLYMIDDSNHCLNVATIDGYVVGYCWIQDYGPHLRTGQKAIRFHDLFVCETYRKKGVARALFENGKQWAKDNGANWFSWNANPNSSSFYTKLGYTPTPEEEEGFPYYEVEFID
ncbi:GNAT family N-acetyltransferase [Alteribacter populi]|uniref:GNAT family N-acetyltransferase n=1 Tax=Alteribacter populi TaxID=2011011 RepID=UPI0012FFA87A|nr:GNAT family N-acetyltransferase [Alteribacter populi]